jgi:hypothetical protein
MVFHEATSYCAVNDRSELIAANKASRDGVWLRRLLNSIGIKQKEPTEILRDNQPAVHLIKNPIDHKRTKHVDIRFLYIRERIGVKEIQVNYVNTRDQIADVLTKGIQMWRLLNALSI